MTNAGDLIVQLDAAMRRRRLEDDVRHGLTDHPKWTSPVWFYDERGSQLFSEITRLPEYYLGRAERMILETNASEIARIASCDTLVELGAGTSEKTRLLLDAMAATGLLRYFVPLDVDVETLRSASETIADEYPAIAVRPVVSDFMDLHALPRPGRSRLIGFLGSTIGNLTPPVRSRFLFDLEANLSYLDRVLVGFDLVKDEKRLVAAYDDASGITAQFNKNVLFVLNRELGATFDPDAFDHVALWDPVQRWIELRLRSSRAQTVRVGALDLEVTFEEGEEMRTEISAKFTEEQVDEELAAAGIVVDKTWTDDDAMFLLVLGYPYC